MKNSITLLLISILLLSCNNGKKNNSSSKDYLETVVGTVNNGEYILSEPELIKEKWEAELAKKKPGMTLEAFEITKGKTSGDTEEEYYMLLSRTEDGTVTAAALLTLKGNEFYFESSEGTGGSIHTLIMCMGDCREGCMPTVSISNGIKYLNCSPCMDCSKLEKGMR